MRPSRLLWAIMVFHCHLDRQFCALMTLDRVFLKVFLPYTFAINTANNLSSRYIQQYHERDGALITAQCSAASIFSQPSWEVGHRLRKMQANHYWLLQIEDHSGVSTAEPAGRVAQPDLPLRLRWYVVIWCWSWWRGAPLDGWCTWRLAFHSGLHLPSSLQGNCPYPTSLYRIRSRVTNSRHGIRTPPDYAPKTCRPISRRCHFALGRYQEAYAVECVTLIR